MTRPAEAHSGDLGSDAQPLDVRGYVMPGDPACMSFAITPVAIPELVSLIPARKPAVQASEPG
jgi:hypothetical protein